MQDKREQRALMHFNKKENADTVRKALEKAGRRDLIPVLLGNRMDNKKYQHTGNESSGRNKKYKKQIRNKK